MLIFLWFIFLFGVAIVLEYSILFGWFYNTNDFTQCPNCSFKSETKSKGTHSCENCSFDFHVSRKGEGIKYSLKENYILFVLSIILLSGTIFLLKAHLDDYSIKMSSFFNSVKEVSVMFLFTYFASSGFYKGVKGYRYYQSQKKSERE